MRGHDEVSSKMRIHIAQLEQRDRELEKKTLKQAGDLRQALPSPLLPLPSLPSSLLPSLSLAPQLVHSPHIIVLLLKAPLPPSSQFLFLQSARH